ncbi:MAG: CehA/McbA family metallohydrolase [Myxococcales bacterium]|nr:CehA/McbA family metallohydrolase [Myxococcales bacterium]
MHQPDAVRFLAVLAVLGATGAARAEPPAASWYRGAVHTHANWGAPQLPTTSPDRVVRWYREHGYHFVSVTDLNYLTPAEGLKGLFDAPGRFLLIPGIELSQEGLPGGKIVDTIGLGVTSFPEAAPGADVASALDSQAKAIRRAGGLPIAAHPNLTYAVTAQDLLGSDRVATARFFEVWNTEPGMNNQGGGGRPSTETIWDTVLSSGRVLYATAVDDAHHFEDFAPREASRQVSNPGKAWIMVRAAELSQKALLEAMERGDFYATTGVILESYEATPAAVRIGLSDRTRDLGWSQPGTNPQLYRTEFIGNGGRVLHTDESPRPTYKLTGKELYVRARITSSDGLWAWTQPVFPKAHRP